MQDMNQHRQAASGEDRTPKAKTDEDRSFQRRDDDGSNHPLIGAKRVNGSAVVNQAGERIGQIEDIAIDKRTGKVAYAILSFGGFLGLGEEHQPLPWSALDYDPSKEAYVVEVTEEFLKLAPKLDTSELSGWDDSDQREAFHGYYAPMGVRPYW